MISLKDEIKEILEYLKDENEYYNETEQVTVDYGEIILEKEDIDKLLDYITNLQKENNNLKEDFKRHIDRINELTERSDNLQEENERLKELCDKYEEEHNTTFQEWLKELKEE